jgi:FMN reductase
VLVELGATCPTAGLFLLDSEWDSGPALGDWLERATPQVSATRQLRAAAGQG